VELWSCALPAALKCAEQPRRLSLRQAFADHILRNALYQLGVELVPYLELAWAPDIDVRFHPGFNERRSRLHHHANALWDFE
jgi:hypothetical protein